MGFPLGFTGYAAAGTDGRDALHAMAQELQRRKATVQWRNEKEFSFSVPIFRIAGPHLDALTVLDRGRIWVNEDRGDRLDYEVSYSRFVVLMSVQLLLLVALLYVTGVRGEQFGAIVLIMVACVLFGNYIAARLLWPRFVRKMARATGT